MLHVLVARVYTNMQCRVRVRMLHVLVARVCTNMQCRVRVRMLHVLVARVYTNMQCRIRVRMLHVLVARVYTNMQCRARPSLLASPVRTFINQCLKFNFNFFFIDYVCPWTLLVSSCSECSACFLADFDLLNYNPFFPRILYDRLFIAMQGEAYVLRAEVPH